MGAKSVKKKAAYQAACRRQVKDGMINTAQGTWERADMTKAMHRDQYYGYHFGTSKKRAAKASEVE